MKNLCLLIIFLGMALAGSAQSSFYVYFETDDATPFYLKIDDKVYTSWSAGYFTLADQIGDSCRFSLGFPGTIIEARYRIAIDGRDHGYQLRHSLSGIELVELNSSTAVVSENSLQGSEVTYRYRTNDFTALLSRASNDTSLFYIPVITARPVIAANNNPPPKPLDTAYALPVAKSNPPDSSVFVQPTGDTVATAIVSTDPPGSQHARPLDSAKLGVVGNDSLAGSTVTRDPIEPKIGGRDTTSSSRDSLNMIPPSININADSLQRNMSDSLQRIMSDSVQLILPDSARTHLVKQPTGELPAESTATPPYSRSHVTRHAESSTSEGFGLVYYDRYEGGIDTIRLIIPNPRMVFVTPDTSHFQDGMLERTDASSVQKSVPCKEIATEKDFFKLRKAMAAKDTEGEMVAEAKKTFKTRCFSVQQLRDLGNLFLTPGGKFLFYQGGINSVTDRDRLPSLEKELNDDYYQQQYRTLIGL